jgi:hypothetical protein
MHLRINNQYIMLFKPLLVYFKYNKYLFVFKIKNLIQNYNMNLYFCPFINLHLFSLRD